MNSLDELIRKVSKLPGLGPRSARRIVIHLVKDQQKVMRPLISLLQQVDSEIKICSICANLDIASPCNICIDPKRDQSLICVVEDITDLWAMERGRFFKGTYHILGGTLSALDGRTPDKLNFESLKDRWTYLVLYQ